MNEKENMILYLTNEWFITYYNMKEMEVRQFLFFFLYFFRKEYKDTLLFLIFDKLYFLIKFYII